MKHFINIKDIPSKDLRKILEDAKKRKNRRKNSNTLDIDKDKPLSGKLLIQMFEKPSSRTRLSFYLAIKQLGGGTLTLKSKEIHLGKGGESLADTAKILSSYGDGFMLRTDSDKKIDDFKKYLISNNVKYQDVKNMPNHANVIIVDDMPDFTRNVANILDLDDILVKVFNSPEHFLNFAASLSFSSCKYLVMDYSMPKYSGYDVFKKLYEIKEGCLPFEMLLYTANINQIRDEEKEYMRSLGIEFLQKPNILELINKITEKVA